MRTEPGLARTKRYASEEEELRRWREGLETALRRRRSRLGGLLRWTAYLLAVLLVMSGAAAGLLWKDIERRIRRADLDVDPLAGAVRNVLVIGTDSREFVETPEDVRRFGRVGGKRADTIILVQVVPAQRRAVLVQFPRDLWVHIPGVGMGKINSAFQYGPGKVIETVRELTGIPINHYVGVDFQGFRKLVDAIGGVDVCLDRPLRDSVLRFRLPAGVNHLDGEAALTFVRARHADPDGDFGRIRRQQQFLRAVVAKLGRPSVLLNPLRVRSLVTAFASNVTTDRDFRLSDMARLARNVRSVRPEQMQTYTVPGEVGRGGGQSVVFMDRDQAERLFEALRRGEDPAVALAPAPVRVVVEDASGRGVGPGVAEELRQRGFEVLGVVQAPGVQSRTVVRAPRVKANDARRVLAVVPGGRLDLGGAGEIRLVLGSGFRGLARPPKGEAPQPGGPCEGFTPGG